MNHSQYLLLFLLLNYIFVEGQYTSDDWNWRDSWMKVDQLFEITNLKTGDKVADIGSHEGYLTMHLAKKVSHTGEVFAVDVRNDRLKKLQEHAKQRKLKNIKTIKGDYDNPKLSENSLDIIYVIDTYHEMDSYRKMLTHFKKSLKSGGRILFLEKIKKHVKGKSRVKQVTAHSLALKYVKKELKETGFTIIKEIENFGYWEEDNTKQMWVLVAIKE